MKTIKDRLHIKTKLKEKGIKGIVYWTSNTILIKKSKDFYKTKELFPNYKILVYKKPLFTPPPKQKTKLIINAVSGSFYWVTPFEGDSFEPAKCSDYYGTGTLYFRFTDGSIIPIKNAWEVEPLNYLYKSRTQQNKTKQYENP